MNSCWTSCESAGFGFVQLSNRDRYLRELLAGRWCRERSCYPKSACWKSTSVTLSRDGCDTGCLYSNGGFEG